MPSFPTELKNHLGERLDFALHRAAAPDAPLVILGHGLSGNKDRPLLVALAEALRERGISALRVSFAGNGASEGRFEESTISKEVQELGAVIDALGVPAAGYIGHSMGAAVGVLRAGGDERIQFLVSLAGMAHTTSFVEREFSSLRPDIDTMWGQPEYPLSQAFLDDMKRIDSVVPAARKISVPWLLVHGLADEVVPVQDTRDLHEIAGDAQRVEIADADHLFSDAHTAHLVQAVVDWVADQNA